MSPHYISWTHVLEFMFSVKGWILLNIFSEDKEWGAEYTHLLPPKFHEFVVNHTQCPCQCKLSASSWPLVTWSRISWNLKACALCNVRLMIGWNCRWWHADTFNFRFWVHACYITLKTSNTVCFCESCINPSTCNYVYSQQMYKRGLNISK